MLTRNQREETRRCLSELQQVKAEGYELETILVDNASSDGTVKVISKQFPSVRLIVNKVNRGFAAAVNQGMKLALKDKDMAFVLQLNNDTFLNKKFLPQLLKTASSSKTIGMVAPALKHYQKDKLFFGMEGHLDLKKGLPQHRNLRLIKSRKIIKADFVSGCCLLIKREVLEKAGLLDEKFYLYLDDVDYCLTVQKAGFKTVLDPQAIIGHKVSASFKNPLAKLPHSFRSHLIFIWKWVPWPDKISAWWRCFWFYPFLAIIWGLPLLKNRSFKNN